MNCLIECSEASGSWHTGTAYVTDCVRHDTLFFLNGEIDLFHSNDRSEFLAKLPVLDPVAERLVILSAFSLAPTTASGPSMKPLGKSMN